MIAGLARRSIVALLLAAAVTIAAAARADTKPARVGIVWIGERGSDDSGTIAGLRQGLRERGYVEGRTIQLEERYANGQPERVPVLIAELLVLKVDLLVTPGSAATRAAQSLTSTVPIMSVSGDPVATGLVASLARPGGNVTGMSMQSGEYAGKWLELLHEAVPGLHHIAVLVEPDNPAITIQLERMKLVAPILGFELDAFPAYPTEIEAPLAAIVKAGAEGLVVPDDPYFGSIAPRLIAFATERRLPAIYGLGHGVELGGLMSYSVDIPDLYRRAAGYIDRILKGARPADLPVEQASEFSLRINLNTAKALGLAIPQSILARADEVIE